MAFWWGINSLIGHAPSAAVMECIPRPPAAAVAISSSPSSRAVESSPSVVNQPSPQPNPAHKPPAQRARPPFVEEALGASLTKTNDGAAWNSRDRFRFLKCSEDGGKMGSSFSCFSSSGKFGGREGEGVWCLTGSAVVWNRRESEGDGGKGRWEGR